MYSYLKKITLKQDFPEELTKTPMCRQYKDRVLKLYYEGLRLRTIAKVLEIPPNVVFYIVYNDPHVPRLKDYYSELKRRDEAILKYLKLNPLKTMQNVADHFKVKWGIVQSVCRKSNYKKSNPEMLCALKKYPLIKKMIKAGKTHGEIIHKLHVNSNTITAIRHGWIN